MKTFQEREKKNILFRLLKQIIFSVFFVYKKILKFKVYKYKNVYM